MVQKILVIDDDYDLRTMTCDFLTSKSYETFFASNGYEGLDVAKRERPDLIILDVSMPGLDGFAVVNALRKAEEVAHVPIIAFTAHALRGDKERILQGGYDSYIAKPFQPAEMLKTIQQLLEKNPRLAA